MLPENDEDAMLDELTVENGPIAVGVHVAANGGIRHYDAGGRSKLLNRINWHSGLVISNVFSSATAVYGKLREQNFVKIKKRILAMFTNIFTGVYAKIMLRRCTKPRSTSTSGTAKTHKSVATTRATNTSCLYKVYRHNIQVYRL